ncbi:Sec1 family domain-containing protein 1 [Echinococcus granulosus]|nr:Sec1 family domain-containing protein 1 [Echinococcus granulosus]
MACSLRERKIEALKCMLNFNTASTKEDEPQWKLLIYDRIGQDIIAPLFSVKELRSVGVTLHLLLDIKREPIPDVPAVYFVYPSKANITRICQDFESDLYSSYYLNFISPISRENLELLAETALTEDCIQRIKKVYDQYTRFICLEDDLFVLNEQLSSQEGTFYALNKTSCNEEDILRTTGFIVDSLYSVFATLGTVPIIRSSRFNAAEAVAKDLDNRFRESLRDSRNTLFSGMEHRAFSEAGKNGGASAAALNPFSFQRPLLIILDRVLDLATPLHHAWTYQSLLHDIVGIHLNHVEMGTQNLGEADDVRQAKMKRYDLTTSTDRIWRTHRASPFSDVAGALQEELGVLQDREKKLGALKASVAEGQTSSTNGGVSGVSTDATSALTSTINTLPQLMEQKRCVDMHMHIATSLAKEIKNRQLDLLNDVEEKLITLQSLQEHSLPDLLKMECFSGEDKLRLLLIAALSCNSASAGSPSGGGGGGSANGGGSSGVGAGSSSIAFNLSSSDLDRYGEQLKAANPDLDISAIRYVHQLRRIARLSQAGAGTSGTASEAGKSSTGRAMFNKLVSHGSAMFLEGMRVLSGRKSYFPFTQIVSQLVENKSDMEDYSYFDPKLHKRAVGGGGATSVPRAKQPFYDVYVFVVGGGTYTEYHNLLQWSRSSTTPGGASGGGGLGGSATHGSSSSLNALGLSLSGSGTSLVDLTTSGTASAAASGTASTRRITYGGTEILTPKLFLDQLTRLGREA